MPSDWLAGRPAASARADPGLREQYSAVKRRVGAGADRARFSGLVPWSPFVTSVKLARAVLPYRVPGVVLATWLLAR
jgi:hypothetical protein